MDPISQGVLGAAVSQSVVKEKGHMLPAFIMGWLAGMAADLDILIQSASDPLLSLEYHRHFTHSLSFIPIGSLICAFIFLPFFKKKIPFKTIYLFSFLGYATHALLDSCTTYGTQLFWPFSNMRISWNNVSVIDPLFTLPLLALILVSLFKKKNTYARIAFVYAIAYLLFGVLQRERAENAITMLVKTRGHWPVEISAKPSFGNVILWKTIYQFQDRFYVDAVKIGFNPKIYPGASIEKFQWELHTPNIPKDSVQGRDIERFRWFSSDYLSPHPELNNVLVDMRYSLIPNQINPLWGIEVNPAQPDTHVQRKTFHSMSVQSRLEFFKMLFDKEK